MSTANATEKTDTTAIELFMENQKQSNNTPLTFWQLLTSTFAAAIGVQSKKNRARDFSRGKAEQFIAMGIAFTVCFVLAIVLLVNLVLP